MEFLSTYLNIVHIYMNISYNDTMHKEIRDIIVIDVILVFIL